MRFISNVRFTKYEFVSLKFNFLKKKKKIGKSIKSEPKQLLHARHKSPFAGSLFPFVFPVFGNEEPVDVPFIINILCNINSESRYVFKPPPNKYSCVTIIVAINSSSKQYKYVNLQTYHIRTGVCPFILWYVINVCIKYTNTARPDLTKSTVEHVTRWWRIL